MAANVADPRVSEIDPADFIYLWGAAFIGEGVPSPDTLKEVGRALHAVQEFLLDPIESALKKIAAEAVPDDERTYPIPENERAVSYADIGRLIIWTDELRKDIGFMLDPVVNVALLAHEDLQAVATGYTTDGVLEDRSWNTAMRRFHGLDEPLGA